MEEVLRPVEVEVEAAQGSWGGDSSVQTWRLRMEVSIPTQA